MNILIVSYEYFPFIKVGGLADAISSLGKQFANKGHSIEVSFPYFKKPLEKYQKEIISTEKEGFYTIPSHIQNLNINIIDDTQTPKLFDGEIYSSYSYFDSDKDYSRFTYLIKASFDLCEQKNFKPDWVIFNDWIGGAGPSMLNLRKENSFWKKTKSLFLVHNMHHQGIFSTLPKNPTIPTDWISKETKTSITKSKENLNLLKEALIHCDKIITVSPTYRDETLAGSVSEKIEILLKKREKDFFGILNGMDSTLWDSSQDPFLEEYKYSAEDLSPKKELKRKIQKQFRLPEVDDKPLFVMISRLVEQKGVNYLFLPQTGALARSCEKGNAQFVILGVGDIWCHEALSKLRYNYPDELAFSTIFSEELAHLLEGGGDFFLMPSLYEPCGLNQMYSMKYGTPPIVNPVGGLRDTVEDEKTGLWIEKLSSVGVFNSIEKAIDIWQNNQTFYKEMQQNGMKKEFSWERVADSYLEIMQK